MEKMTLKMVRTKMNISQDEMAQKLGTNRVTYAQYENYVTPMRIDMAYKISELSGIGLDQIFFWKEGTLQVYQTD